MKNETTLLVNPVNKEKVLRKIKSIYPTDENQELIIDVGALYDENVIVDEECCYSFLESRIHNDKRQLVYDVPVRIKKRTEGGWSFPMTVDFYFPISETELKNYLDGEIALKDYMGSRYNYNPRIKTNMREFLKDANVVGCSAKSNCS